MMPSSRWLQLSYVCGSYDKVFLLGISKRNSQTTPELGIKLTEIPRCRWGATIKHCRNKSAPEMRGESAIAVAPF